MHCTVIVWYKYIDVQADERSKSVHFQYHLLKRNSRTLRICKSSPHLLKALLVMCITIKDIGHIIKKMHFGTFRTKVHFYWNTCTITPNIFLISGCKYYKNVFNIWVSLLDNSVLKEVV